MNTTDLNITQNSQEDEDTAAEKQFHRKAGRAFLFLLYSFDALLIGPIFRFGQTFLVHFSAEFPLYFLY